MHAQVALLCVPRPSRPSHPPPTPPAPHILYPPTRVVHQDVQLAVLLLHLAHHVADLLRLAKVGACKPHRRAVLLRHSRALCSQLRLWQQAVHHGGGPPRCQLAQDAQADALGGAWGEGCAKVGGSDAPRAAARVPALRTHRLPVPHALSLRPPSPSSPSPVTRATLPANSWLSSAIARVHTTAAAAKRNVRKAIGCARCRGRVGRWCWRPGGGCVPVGRALLSRLLSPASGACKEALQQLAAPLPPPAHRRGVPGVPWAWQRAFAAHSALVPWLRSLGLSPHRPARS